MMRSVVEPQRDSLHVVPAGWRRHAPWPSHAPSVPQLLLGWASHAARGSWPAGTRVQRPGEVPSAQDRQGPAHSASQQTPSTQ